MRNLTSDQLPYYVYEDYQRWEGDWELIKGIPYAMSPAPSIQHQAISNKIAWQLEEELSNCEQCSALLPVDWKIGKDTIVQPDNLVICHKPLIDQYITQAPELIFEILSKSTAQKDTGLKFELYQNEGVKYFVIVDPDETMAKVYELQNGQYIKDCDAYDKVVAFSLSACEFEFDFSKIW